MFFRKRRNLKKSEAAAKRRDKEVRKNIDSAVWPKGAKLVSCSKCGRGN